MMKKLLLCFLAVFVTMCVCAQRTWDFTGTWSIDANTTDDNLVLDAGNRFNYVPATTLGPLVFASTGTEIADTEGLRFTQGGSNKLRLGFDTKMVYLNGKDLTVAIPCSVGDLVTIEAVQGNATAVDRGFSVSGGTVDATNTSAEIVNGIITVANTTAVFAYIATATSVELKTIVGGMNIKKIIVGSGSNSAIPEIPNSTKEIQGVRYFTILGQETTSDAKGLLVKRTSYTDGTVSTQKIYQNKE